jgi:hypothetical protein
MSGLDGVSPHRFLRRWRWRLGPREIKASGLAGNGSGDPCPTIASQIQALESGPNGSAHSPYNQLEFNILQHIINNGYGKRIKPIQAMHFDESQLAQFHARQGESRLRGTLNPPFIDVLFRFGRE